MLLAFGVLLGLYVTLIVVACSAYRLALYPAPSNPTPVPTANLRTFRAKDGADVHALHYKAPDGARTVVHFHGNGETIGEGGYRAQELVTRGLGVVLVEYRGYGVSKGNSPTEEGLYADAEAVLDGLSKEGIGPDRIVLFGLSLGTGVASEMARRGKCASLVMMAPYTSIPKLAARLVPLLPLPTSLIVRDRFDTLSKAPQIHVPTLVIHGTDDEIIPHDMGVQVAKAIVGSRIITVPGGHHNDLFAVDGAHVFDAIATYAKL